MTTIDRNDLAHWFPRLQAAGVPVPRTEIVATDVDLSPILDGIRPDGYDEFIFELGLAIYRVEPRVKSNRTVFLRTGHTSNKHDWRRSCLFEWTDETSSKEWSEGLRARVCNLVEFSACADLIGLPTNTWVVREFVPLWHTFTAFNGMPVAVERRCFLRDGILQCDHGYWPPDALRNPSREDWRSLLADHEDIWRLYDMRTQARAILGRVGEAFPEGYWSVDLALARDGRLLVTDMAEGDRSYHREGCLIARRAEARIP